MPKKTKNESASSAPAKEDSSPGATNPRARARSSKTHGAATTSPAGKEKRAPRAAKKGASKKGLKRNQPAQPSEADIRLRAYFIAERRVQLALQGDPAKDWLEARQQLLQEAKPGKA